VKSHEHPVVHWEHPALSQARRDLEAQPGPVPADYSPPVSTFPGKRPKVIEGQLALGESDG
jgi:hypothetical protein